MVYEIVTSRCDHPDADAVYTDVHAQDPRISKGTVYRNLGVLSENGDIRRIRMPGADRYDKTIVPHYHILCTECGSVTDAPIGYNDSDDAYVSSETGFIIKGHRTVFEGICPACQKKK